MLYVPDKDYVVSAPTSPVSTPTTSKSFPPSDPPASPTFTVVSNLFFSSLDSYFACVIMLLNLQL